MNRIFVFLLLSSASSILCGGTDEFRFVRLEVVVLDEHHKPLAGTTVKLYSKDWPLVYPHGDGFSRTSADGTCTFRVPCGDWTIVAGGGAAHRSPASGAGLFIVKDFVIENDTRIVLEPAPNRSCLLRFFDRSERPAEVDEIYAAPSSLVPNCLMPMIGTTKDGVCRIAADVAEPITLFLVSKPTEGREGYFLVLHCQGFSADIDCRANALTLKPIQFDGRDPRDRPGPIEWVFTFPSLDVGRPAGHISFRATGKVEVYTNLDFFNWFSWLYFGDVQDWRYEFSPQGVDLTESPSGALVVGGPLTANLRILSPSPINLTQFLFDPVDVHGNHVFWYFSTQSPLKIPVEVRDSARGTVLWSTTFDRHQNPGLQTDRSVPSSSLFAIDWDLGPYGGKKYLQGSLDDPLYQYQFETITTAHVTVHAPAGAPGKAVAFADRLEAAYGVYVKWLGRTPPVTQARNFYIEPVGVWASAEGQELFQHGFLSWHPNNPAPIGWQSCCFHEIGHRMELEHFTVEGRLIGPGGQEGELAEAFADLLMSLAMDALHGPQVGQFSRRPNTDWFFDTLAGTPRDGTREPRNVRFLIETYLPKRFGPDITTGFFQRWTEAWSVLSAKGFSQDETCAALYSVLAGQNLSSLFALCDPNTTEIRIAEAMKLLPGDRR